MTYANSLVKDAAMAVVTVLVKVEAIGELAAVLYQAIKAPLRIL